MKHSDRSRSDFHLPLSDESYQGPPDLSFDSSQAEGVAAFKRSTGLGDAAASLAAARHRAVAAQAYSSGDERSLVSTWANASANAGLPTDFGFLMGKCSHRNGLEVADEVDTDFDGRGRRDDSPSNRKRGRVDEAPSATASRGPSQAVMGPLTAPRPPMRPRPVVFGKVEGEERGPKAMDPPIVKYDPYSWLRTEDVHHHAEIKGHLEREEQHTKASLAHLEPLSEVLYQEMMGHQVEADTSLVVPYDATFGYFTRTFVGKSYSVHYRKQRLASDPTRWSEEEELILDENELAIDPATGSKRPYCSVSGWESNPACTLIVYGTDFAGNDAYTLHLTACPNWPQHLPVPRLELPGTNGSVQWDVRGDSFYYVVLDEEFRSCSVKRHVLGQHPAGLEDALLFKEPDQRFSVSISVTGCKRYLVISTASSETSEAHLLDMRHPEAGLRRVAERSFAHSYSVDHRDGWLYLLTNKDGAKDSKLCRAPLNALPDTSPSTWEDWWVPGPGIGLDSHACFKDFLALEGRDRGACRIFVRAYAPPGEEANGVQHHTVAFPDAAGHSGRVETPRGAQASSAAFSAGLAENHLFDTGVLWYCYSSFTLPSLTYEYNVRQRQHKLLRRQAVPNFDANLYRAERLVTEASKVPISLVYRKDLYPRGLAGGPFPTLLTGYGAYGCCSDPDFDGNRLSLLDRGVVYAQAHVRGGGECGRVWYEEGRYMFVKNRFRDFVEAAETLQALRIAEPGRLAAWGTSSGGLLVAASMNLRPDLFAAVLLEVPFVDVLGTMSDPSIPLTIGEWEEIGNPNERDYFYYMLEYSPYENIRMEAYPAALVTASLNDTMVGYWEPVKYVAKLRHLKTDDRPVLLQVNWHAGHGSSSDRYESTREAALQFAFLLDRLGLRDRPAAGKGEAKPSYATAGAGSAPGMVQCVSFGGGDMPVDATGDP